MQAIGLAVRRGETCAGSLLAVCKSAKRSAWLPINRLSKKSAGGLRQALDRTYGENHVRSHQGRRKQFRVAANDEITVNRQQGEPGDVLAFDSVLTLTDGETVHVGAPYVAGATVAAEIVSHERGEKVIAFRSAAARIPSARVAIAMS